MTDKGQTSSKHQKTTGEKKRKKSSWISRNGHNTHEHDEYIEMECNTCGDHAMCNPSKINICCGCDSGVMVKYIRKERI